MGTELATYLVKQGTISPQQANELLQKMVLSGGSFDTQLLENDLLDETSCLQAMAATFNMDIASKQDIDATPPEVAITFPLLFAQMHNLVPHRFQNGALVVLATVPPKPEEMQNLIKRLGVKVVVRITVEARIHYALNKMYGLEIPARFNNLLAKLDGKVLNRHSLARIKAVWSITSQPVPEQEIKIGEVNKSIDASTLREELIRATDRDMIVDLLLEATLANFSFVALFSVVHSTISGWACRGGSGTETVQDISQELSTPSMLQTVVLTESPYLGRLPKTDTNQAILESMSRPWPTASFLAPLRVGGKVVAVLYGDTSICKLSNESVKNLLVIVAAASKGLENVIRRNKKQLRQSLEAMVKAEQAAAEQAQAQAQQTQIEQVPTQQVQTQPAQVQPAPVQVATPQPQVQQIQPAQAPQVQAQPAQVQPAPAQVATPKPQMQQIQPAQAPQIQAPEAHEQPVAVAVTSASETTTAATTTAQPVPAAKSNMPSTAAALLSAIANDLDDDDDDDDGWDDMDEDAAAIVSLPGAETDPESTCEKEAPLATQAADLETGRSQALIAKWRLVIAEIRDGKQTQPTTPAPVRNPEDEIRQKVHELLAAFVTTQIDPATFQNIGRQLLAMPDELLLPELCAVFPGQLTVDPFIPGVRLPLPEQLSVLLALLMQMGNRAEPVITSGIESPDPRTRFVAAYLLSRIYSLNLVEKLGILLYDPEAKVRFAAAYAMRRYANTKEYEQVLQFIREQLNQADINQQMATIQLITQLRDCQAIPQLIDALHYPNAALITAITAALLTITGQAFGNNIVYWQKWWQVNSNISREYWLLDGLNHRDPTVRQVANAELMAITGFNAGFNPRDIDSNRLAAIQRWTAFLANRK